MSKMSDDKKHALKDLIRQLYMLERHHKMSRKSLSKF
jgi:hypothetical protein